MSLTPYHGLALSSPGIHPAILAAGILGFSALGSLGYLKITLRRLKRGHAISEEALRSSPAFLASNGDQQISLTSYIHRAYRIADRKRVIHEMLSNSFAILGGGIPAIAHIVPTDGFPAVAGDISGLTVLVLRVLQSIRFAADNHRVSQQISNELELWRTSAGRYSSMASADEKFRNLIVAVQAIVDTNISSFKPGTDNANSPEAIPTSTSPGLGAQGHSADGPVATAPVSVADRTSGRPIDMGPRRLSGREAAAAIDLAMARPAPPESTSGGAIGPSVIRAPVDPTEFAAWQQTAINESHDDPISQIVEGGA